MELITFFLFLGLVQVLNSSHFIISFFGSSKSLLDVMGVSCMSFSSDAFNIFTMVNVSLFLIQSSGTLHSAIALTNSEVTKGDI